MTDLSNVTLVEIENKIMIILVTNEGKIFTQSQLFDKVIDKFETKSYSINNSFKSKFILVLRNLMSNYSDVKIIKENNIYKAVYNPIEKNNDKTNDKSNDKNIQDDNLNLNLNFDFDFNEINSYIIDNDIFDELNYVDPICGNTIYHDIISNNNYLNVNKLIETNKFNYTVKNFNNKTPIDYINDQQITNLMIKTLFNKINLLEKEIDTLKNKDISLCINELTFYQFLKIKLFTFYNKYKISIFILYIGIIIIYFVSQN